MPSPLSRMVARESSMMTGVPSVLKMTLPSASTAATLTRLTVKSASAALSIASAVWRPSIGVPRWCHGRWWLLYANRAFPLLISRL